MQVYSLEPLAKTMAINSIIAYQNNISPHKGFSCPHRLLHGGDSCSDYVKRMLTNQSLTEVVKSSVQRFHSLYSSK
jgi:putative component of membrane protein insertase Oxa1/YidC/SpoIIIJ protein YidD